MLVSIVETSEFELSYSAQLNPLLRESGSCVLPLQCVSRASVGLLVYTNAVICCCSCTKQ